MASDAEIANDPRWSDFSNEELFMTFLSVRDELVRRGVYHYHKEGGDNGE